MQLYLAEELQQKDEEAIIESTAIWWSQPDLSEREEECRPLRGLRWPHGSVHPTPGQKELFLGLVSGESSSGLRSLGSCQFIQ